MGGPHPSAADLAGAARGMRAVSKERAHMYTGTRGDSCLPTRGKTCLNPEFLQEQLQNYHARTMFVFLRGPTTWRVVPRNVWNDIVSWQTRRHNNSTKYLLHASMTTTSKKKK